MMNYVYPLDHDGMVTDAKRTKIASETACVLVQKMETEEWFIALTGGGMNLSPDIAYAYVIAQKWLPTGFMYSLDVRYCKNELGEEQFETLRDIMEQQSRMTKEEMADMHAKWKAAKEDKPKAGNPA